MSQLTLFDGSQKFTINKPIRLIELFGGYGSQALALKYLGVKFEHWKLCEWAVKSIQAYKDIHFAEDNTDYSKDHSDEFILNRLFKWGISANYNEPMTKEQIKRLGSAKQRQIYNNIKATYNLVNISQVKGEDLQIEQTNKYCYIMTYSYPCQDLSKAGKGAGMAKGSGTRSGLLWEVERILDECNSLNQLPQVLLMENVPDVIGSKNIKHFAKWVEKLESLGYHCYWKVLNAKDFGIPQNRERCFMVSILGDYYYEFPEPIKLEHRLKDLLEENVDEKYYWSDKMLNCLSVSLVANGGGVGVKTGLYAVNIDGKDYPLTKNYENYIEWHQDGLLDMDTRAWKDDKIAPTIHTNCGKIKILEKQNLKTQLCNELIAKSFRIRKLCPIEVFRLMGVKDEDFDKISKNQSNASLYHLAGDALITFIITALIGNMLSNFRKDNFLQIINDFYLQISN